MNTEDLLYRLLSIGSIKVGETLSTTTFLPIEKAIWSTTFSRTYNRENRKKTVNCIKEVVDAALKEVNNEELNDALVSSIKGLENLKETYKGDFELLGSISTIINTIRTPMIKKIVEVNDDLFDAVKRQDVDYIENYLYEGKNINTLNLEKQNILHVACDKKYYNKTILDLLLNFNIDLTCRDEENATPLYVAVSTGCCEAILALEEAIANKKKSH